MIELSKHIEILLLENDCVVVPELGGFIAHYQPAHYEENEGVFLPPIRTVGFNPQLTMNDGLLTQSYMQVYHTDFPDATRKIAAKVEELKEILFQEGVVEMHGIGRLHYNIQGEYEFHPQENGILSPSLYGLDSFSMPLLTEKQAMEEVPVAEAPKVLSLPVKEKKEIRLNPHWLGNAVAVAVAAVLFFVLSVPVENTYIDKGNYASLGTDCLFDAIRSQSMATVLIGSPVEEPQQKKEKQHLKPVAVRVEKVAPASKEETPATPVVSKKVNVAPDAAKAKPEGKKETVAAKKEVIPTVAPKKEVSRKEVSSSKKKYHIIVASLPTSSDAQKMIQTYKQKGYSTASVVEGSGRYRIALCSYSDKEAAYKKLNSLKQEEAFKNAWMLSSK